ncbi:tRNA lysidine(34) synthetase TilS [Arthrobacter livingstonensis]|uniref:tRNA(Ile)-lysidine synthase n=1 Tax=Arthrobacter livingstonensis TaxID=670078 RepID=A0A2V5L8B6_9MICC|nr:tRNA lysidine(34) synthetase TilS [Arthrobacter livingstonensis]PYI66952.1 tRNA lysidine(34) synthetase TilS [Arthrobacter livingstonensis]
MVAELLGLSTTGKHHPLEHPPLLLVGCSGGPDSLALAAVTAFFATRGEVRVGAVVVDHQMQPDSAGVAARTAEQLRGLGLDPVQVRTVDLEHDGGGPEAAARSARFGALDAAARELGAATVLLGHTMDDQAESVLLGLARGSGTRSLAGMRARRGLYARPFLKLRRDETLAICRALELEPWHDPANSDGSYLRVRVRHNVLPFLAAELGPAVTESLARSAAILGHDADLLDELADAEFGRIAQVLPADGADPMEVSLPEETLRGLAPALRMRVLAKSVVVLGGLQPSQERLGAAEALLERKGSAGPVQMAGKVSAYRISRRQAVPQEGTGYGKLVLRRSV